MPQEHLPFALPDISEDEIEAAVEAMRSGWLTTGPRVAEFEREFANFLGGGDIQAVAVNSATAGLHLALEAIGAGPGDEVIVPTWTFTATAEVVRYLGATPVLVDVNPSSLNLTAASVEAAISPRTKALMPVHFAGLPVDPAVRSLAAARGIPVVEDAAHAFPADDGTGPVGAGDAAATVFSFYATKTITTGEGGMVVTRDPALAQRMRTMRLHGISRDVFDRYRSTAPAWRYEVVAPGYKYNLTDPAAAMGLVQLRRARAMRDRRAAIAQTYLDAFADLPVDLPARGGREVLHAWHLFVIRMRTEGGRSRDAFIEEMAKAGVGCSVHFIPLHLHPYWHDSLGARPDDLPVASAEFERVVSLPAFSAMTDAQVERVVGAVRRVLT
ncbi:DegT/DnrJ/EryC1/StrS family aminotransferase [Knoellia koreensis]|uniref:DegT/DnrJ/EryC1/StrS family aminotransferase n=1 Tax=Knoellia koreensis TaxID=2730921 RepID=A0A849HME7_9MICO|nr:DegT/DnrJ/EryC1/StrS family aminotransferase [Knoellia sp. DB2414S]NNM45777.1 DegT/DnrJ/EryC1/StrS family aminotransferase [Knoellia sp. DB2414S]